MTKKKDIDLYRHEDETRKNAVPVGLIPYDISKLNPKRYYYDPHLDPHLIWSWKKELRSFEVPTVSLYIQERITPKAELND